MSVDEEVEIVVVDVRAVARGMRVSALLGIPVSNEDDDEIGTIDDLIVENDRPGRISFAVVEIGGFLGIGGRLIAIEYDSLQITRRDEELRVVLPGATREALEALPAFEYGS
jgi:sporulation protein YlmC with PRC-barrel domain